MGGYAGTPPPELLTKWIEVGTFQSIDRDHSEKGTGDQEPWVGSSEQESVRRRFIETRYRLMPYLYTLADEASRTGLPMLRPLFLEFPDATADHHPIDIDPQAASEFLLGSELLVAPPPYPDAQDAYSVELPTLDWYNFWTGEKVPHADSPAPATSDPPASTNSTTPLLIHVTPALDQLPVFVRAGSILPIAPVVQSTNEIPKGALTLRVYVGDRCSGELYLDDGKTYAFQHGVYLRAKFSCEKTADGLRVTVSPHEGSYPAWWKEIHAEIYGWSSKQGKVFANEKEIPVHLDRDLYSIGFAFADDGNGTEVEVR